MHLGPKLPPYLASALKQARLFNPDIPIYLLANKAALKYLPNELASQIQAVPTESLSQSKEHKQFKTHSKRDKKFRKGFWTFTIERFFYLSAFLKQYKISNAFHLENDVMLYTNLKEILPIFKQYYINMIGATFDSDHRCIPGFLYIANATPLKQLTRFIAKRANTPKNDMEFLSDFRKKYYKKWIDYLPILPPDYTQDHELISPSGLKGAEPFHFFQYFEHFQSIFDAAAIGQYLDGIDPWHEASRPGFINESCIFNPSDFEFSWKEDLQERKIPMIIYKGHEWKINNLHIHSKNLEKFESKKTL